MTAINLTGQCFTDRSKPTANKGFAIAGGQCLADTFVQAESFGLRTKFSAKTPRHRKPPKRYASPYWSIPFFIGV